MNRSYFLHPTYLYWQKYIRSNYRNRKVKIVDFGCGNGILIEVLGENFIHSYIGMDTSIDAIKVASEKYPDSKKYIFHHSIPKSNPSFGKTNSVDFVILIGVFQYLKESEIRHVINESKRVLKKDGELIFSTILDIPFYKFLNLYRFVFPNFYVNRNKLIKLLNKASLSLKIDQARGLIFGPLISHGLVIPFDAIDHYLLGVRGKIGILGRTVRLLFFPLMYIELLIPINYGYTWYAVAKK